MISLIHNYLDLTEKSVFSYNEVKKAIASLYLSNKD